MSKKIRLIARLDVKDEHLVKGIQYEGLRKLGDPHDFALRYYRQGIDELLYLDTVASHFNIKVHDITGSKRPKNIAEPRMVAMYLSRTLTDESLKDIGLAFGGRNHTTVIHAIKQVETDCKTDEELKRTVTTLKRKLHARV